ncbi:TPA: hypothetical protein U0K61_001993 [Streptococcus suis]|nr:hypothetical protein [Streptococcus suis]HEL9630812.1 hypothetical protein [Streptococcus suis]
MTEREFDLIPLLDYKIGDEVLVRGVINSEVRHGGIHVLHDGVDAFYMLDQIHEPQKVVVPKFVAEWDVAG